MILKRGEAEMPFYILWVWLRAGQCDWEELGGIVEKMGRDTYIVDMLNYRMQIRNQIFQNF